MIINEQKGENRTPVYLALLHGQPIDPVFKRYGEEKKQMKPDWKMYDDAVRIYEENTGHFCLAVASETDRSRDSEYEIHVYRGNNPHSIAKAWFSKPDKAKRIFVLKLKVDANENNKGISSLLLSHVMDIATKTLNAKIISLCAHPGYLVDVKPNCTAEEIRKHKEDLIRFYGKFGFIETDRFGDSVNMSYDPNIGYPSPLKYAVGDCQVMAAPLKKQNKLPAADLSK